MRLTILGGFLGSGKSTWLRHHLHHGLLRDALVVVNEAADAPVDDALLAGSSRLRVLAGGCACCETRPALVALLRDICDDRGGGDASARRIDHTLLETHRLPAPRPPQTLMGQGRRSKPFRWTSARRSTGRRSPYGSAH